MLGIVAVIMCVFTTIKAFPCFVAVLVFSFSLVEADEHTCWVFMLRFSRVLSSVMRFLVILS